MALTERVRHWQATGESAEFRGSSIHTFRREGDGPLLLLLHGFPSSSYDWRLLLEEEPGRNVLAFDFLGFGLSSKPRETRNSLFWQADLTEELVRRHGGGRDWPGDLRLAWGLLDRVSTTDVLAALRELRPAVPVAELPELAHYPQLEDPRQLARALRAALPAG